MSAQNQPDPQPTSRPVPRRRPVSRQRNVATGLVLGGVALGMIGLAFAAVPLYSLFCQVTGYSGTSQVAVQAPGAKSDRIITVQFDASVAKGMPWSFKPEQREVKVRLGEEALAFYRATNPLTRKVMGTATYNVTPHKAGPYFNKIECFCFTEQVLEPGASADMPVSFFVDPDIINDPNMDDVRTITLSYTFFEKPLPTDGAEGKKTALNAVGDDAKSN